MKKILFLAVAAATLSACANKSAYEAAVEDREPVYCYKSLGGVQCYETPHFRDEKRLVNYFGPAPLRYDRPAPAPEPELRAPAPVDFWVRDPEPVPEPARAFDKNAPSEPAQGEAASASFLDQIRRSAAQPIAASAPVALDPEPGEGTL